MEVIFMDRRNLLKFAALAVAAAGFSATTGGAPASAESNVKTSTKGTSMPMPFIAAKDGTPLFYKDWGSGKPVVFLSSWAMSSDLWQYQMTPMVNHGLRCIAYDRRGHGRSAQPGNGYDYDTLADDLAAVLEAVDLHDVMLIGHSMAPGEMVRYLTRHGSGRVSRMVFVAPTTPFGLKTPDNPEGVGREVFDRARAAWSLDYPKWLAENARGFV